MNKKIKLIKFDFMVVFNKSGTKLLNFNDIKHITSTFFLKIIHSPTSLKNINEVFGLMSFHK